MSVDRQRNERRKFMKSAVWGAAGMGTAWRLTSPISLGAEDEDEQRPLDRYGLRPSVTMTSPVDEMVPSGEKVRITKLETILVKPRWLFLKVHTDAGIVGLGEPIVEGRARTVPKADRGDRTLPGRQRPPARRPSLAGDLSPRLLSRRPGADQRPQRHRPGAVGHQGQGARRAGLRTARRTDAQPRPRLRARLDIPRRPSERKARASPRSRRAVVDRHSIRHRRTAPQFVDQAADAFAALREAAGTTSTSASTSTAPSARRTAKLLIKAFEPYQPMFIEEPVQCQNVEVMAEIARGTSLPIATGERIFTKWGFREILEKRRRRHPPARPVPLPAASPKCG